ncbi:MAG: hypothetical protein HY347_05115 [candidate division NC10 bacterium]|nr:hypothetical protein [candidate division NC10 bacterium]
MQREIEMRGIPTVLITASPEESKLMRPPRSLSPRDFPLGRSLGPPGNALLQRRVLLDALGLFLTPPAPGKIQEREYPDYP